SDVQDREEWRRHSDRRAVRRARGGEGPSGVPRGARAAANGAFEHVSDRAERLTAQFGETGIDVLLVTDLVNVRYLTGYTGSNGLALLGPEVRRFITDFRYVEQAAAEVDPSFDRVQAPVDLLDGVAQGLPDGSLRLGFEEAHMSVRQYGLARERFGDRVELAPT